MTLRGSVCWADLGEPVAGRPAKRRPVVVVQAAPHNHSRLAAGLPRDSVVDVTALVTLDRTGLEPAVGQLPEDLLRAVDEGLRRVLGL